MIYKLRIIYDNPEDILRDIAIESNVSLEDFHNVIVNAFGFDGGEVASFYTCDDNWNQQDEIPLFDTGDIPGNVRIMSDFVLDDILYKKSTKMIYVYDFLNMNTFFVELAEISDNEAGEEYPQLLFSLGVMPLNDNILDDFDNDFETNFSEEDPADDDFDIFDGDDSFDDLDYDDQWN